MTKHYRKEDRFIKVVSKENIISVWDNKFCPEINRNLTPLSILIPENEISAEEFNDVFKRVHKRLEDLLLDIQYNDGYDLTPEIAQLVRNYDSAYMYIEDSGQRRKQEEKNNKIAFRLKELGVKSFEGIDIN